MPKIEKRRNGQVCEIKDVSDPSFQTDLKNLANKQSKDPSKARILHRYAQNFINQAKEEASAKTYAISMTFPIDTLVSESWELLRARMTCVWHTFVHYPTYAVLLAELFHDKQKDESLLCLYGLSETGVSDFVESFFNSSRD